MMSGINLTLYLGKEQPQPVPREIVEALQSTEVTLGDDGRSGFQLVFQVGRSGRGGLEDYKLLNILQNPNYFAPFNRAILVVTINGNARVLIDGAITHQQFVPSTELGRSTFTVIGEDIGVFMDREELSIPHPQQAEQTIVAAILTNPKYAKFNLKLEIGQDKKLGYRDVPGANERIPTQQVTDLQYLQELARRFGYVFYIISGPALRQNIAYWGSPIRTKISQPPITVNMGAYTNVNSINFRFDAQAATQVTGQVQDRITNQIQSVSSTTSNRDPLAKTSGLSLLTDRQVQRVQKFRETARDSMRARVHAQAKVNRTADDIVTVSGELDTIRYGDLLQLRGIVRLRGVGYTYDGNYYVKNVTHQIRKGEYKQSFTITREGLVSIT
jgi:hypothetical protein